MLTIIHDGLLQAHMHALTIHLFTTGQLKKGTNDVQANLRGARITGHSEAISSAGDIDIEAAFYLPQVLIKLAAKIGKAVIIGGFQDDVLRYLYGVQSLEFRPQSIDSSKPTSKAPHMEYFSSQINDLGHQPRIYKASTQRIRQSLRNHDIDELSHAGGIAIKIDPAHVFGPAGILGRVLF